MVQRYIVTNTGDGIVHAWGSCVQRAGAWLGEGGFNDYELRFTSPGLLSPRRTASATDHPTRFFEDAGSFLRLSMDSSISTSRSRSGRCQDLTVTMLGTKGSHGVELDDFDDLSGVGSAPGAPFVIEPGGGNLPRQSDIFEEKRGMESLDLGQSVSLRVLGVAVLVRFHQRFPPSCCKNRRPGKLPGRRFC